MDPNKYSRNIELICPTCGGTQYEYDDTNVDDENAVVRCTSCNRQMTKVELIQENAENIDQHSEEIGQEVLHDAAKELTEGLKRAFRGNKNIKIK
jgi:transcriptional regulator NrdR family protein